jgi:hypothetical protein
MKIRNGFLTLLLLVVAVAGVAHGQSTRTLSLVKGDTLTPASSFVDASGTRTYFSGLVIGSVDSSSPSTFALSLAFSDAGVVNADLGIYGGTIVSPNSSFTVTQASGRKSVTTSGSIGDGTVTFRLTPEGRADIISVVSNNLTIFEGKNKRRTAVGSGSIDYGSVTEGEGTMVLNFF